MADKLARCQATYYPDESYFSTLLNHQPEFFATLFSPLAKAVRWEVIAFSCCNVASVLELPLMA